MARSLAIAAYLARLGSPDGPRDPTEQPPRPEGTIVWARCSDPEQLTAVETLARKLAEDGDPLHIIVTLLDWNPVYAKRALPEPIGRENIQNFIKHWQPAMCVWLKGDLDPILMTEIRAAKIVAMLVDANGEGLEHVAGTWVPGAMKSLLSEFEALLVLDHNAADRLKRAGAPEERVLMTGPMGDAAPTLPCDDAERHEMAGAIGARPVWLAAAAQLDECEHLAEAHKFASRRAHRLLLIIAPRHPVMAHPIAENMRGRGFNVTLQSTKSKPSDITQVYVVDDEVDLGLWYRLAPITYLGGTLDGGGCRDPFEAAALGSAVLYGPQVSPFQRHAARLNGADASRLIRSAADLGPTVETLLSPDKTAQIAHAAWDVTSRGATVTNRIAQFIQTRLEELEQGH